MAMADSAPLSLDALALALDESRALASLSLRGLDLNGYRGGGTAAATPLAALLGRAPLVEVDLKNCHISEKLAIRLAAGLSSAPCLAVLNLGRTSTEACAMHNCDCGIGGKGATAICEALAHVTTLESLDLRRQEIKDEGAAAVGSLLAGHPSLACLVLDDNRVTAQGIASLAAGLALCPAPLAELHLSNNPLGDSGTLALCDAFEARSERSPSLRALSIAMDGYCMQPLKKGVARALPDLAAAHVARLLRCRAAEGLTSLDVSGTFALGMHAAQNPGRWPDGAPVLEAKAASAAGAAALADLWKAMAAHPALTDLQCRLTAPGYGCQHGCAPLSKEQAVELELELLSEPLLSRLLPGHTGRAGMPVLHPLPCGHVDPRKEVQQRFADAAAARHSIDMLWTRAATHPAVPRFHDVLTRSLRDSAGVRVLHINTPLDAESAALLADGLRHHATVHRSLHSLDLRFTRIGATPSGLSQLSDALCTLTVASLDLSFCAIEAPPAALCAYLATDTSLLDLPSSRAAGLGEARVSRRPQTGHARGDARMNPSPEREPRSSRSRSSPGVSGASPAGRRTASTGALPSSPAPTPGRAGASPGRRAPSAAHEERRGEASPSKPNSRRAANERHDVHA
jgi:hypothetical protein